MEAAKIMRTDPQPEQSLVFVKHIRLKCEVCGIIIRPSELERALWFDNRVCPSCCLTVKQSDRSSEFNRILESQAREFESEIIRLESELSITRLQYEQLITEGQQWTDKYQWIDKRVIRLIEGFKQSDDFDLSELDF